MKAMEEDREGLLLGEWRRKWLEFPHQLMFRKVMEADNGICEAFLELVLGFPIERIERKTVEAVKNPTVRARGVRLDVYLKAHDRAMDLEMQASEAYALGKRMRYYQGAMDVSDLMPGDEVEDLLESYVIFVCRRDPFGFGEPRYDLEMRCEQADGLDLETDMHWLVLNAEAFERVADPALRSLLQYISCGTAERADPLVSEIVEEVERINRSDEEVSMFWTLEDQYRLETRHKVQEAQAQGEARGETRLSELMSKLLDGDRIDDAKRAAADADYREALFREFDIA